MISSLLSHDEGNELVNSARANVGLIADTIWTPLDQDDSYRKLNHTLWIRSCKIAANYAEISADGLPRKKRVRDVIPESRLASYGDFEYEDEAELPTAEASPEDEEDAKAVEAEDGHRDRTTKESWMLDEVEEYVARVVGSSKRRRPELQPLLISDGTLNNLQKPSNDAMLIQQKSSKPGCEPPPRFSVTNVSEAQLEGRIFSESVRSLWRTQPRPGEPRPSSTHGLRQCREIGILKPQKQKRPADIQQIHCSLQNERLRIPSRCQYSYVQTINMVHRPLAPLCVDVPEFFPKGPGTPWPIEDHTKPLQSLYPPTSDNPYQDELFPYKGHLANRKTVTVYQNALVPIIPTPIVSAIMWPSQAWTQRILPGPIHIHQIPNPLTTASQTVTIQQQQQQQQQQPQPASQATANVCPTIVHRPIRMQEVTTNKSTTTQQPTTASQKLPTSLPTHQRSGKLGSDYPQRRKNQGVDFNNLILLTKSAMKVRRNQIKGPKKYLADATARLQSSTIVAAAVKADAQPMRWFDKGCQPVTPTNRRRERDYVTVCTSIPRATPGRRTDASKEEADKEVDTPATKRLYRDVLGGSGQAEDSEFERRYDELERQAMEQYRTSEECLALRYQELEQQAMEQYKNAESSENISAEFESHSSNPRNDSEEGVNNIVDDDVNAKTRECSSGFGKYNHSKKVPGADEKGNELQQRIKILKPESAKSAAAVHRAASEGSLQPIAVAKRLATINASSGSSSSSYGRESKNTIRGASREKIGKIIIIVVELIKAWL